MDHLFRTLLFMVRAAARLSRNHLSKRYDIVHVHNVPDFLVFSALLPKLAGAKVILDIHDIVPELFASKFGASRSGLLFKAARFTERISVSFSDYVIVSNHIWLKKLAARTSSRTKSSVVMNYPDTNILHPRRQPPKKDRFVVVYPGTLSRHQGVDIAIKSFVRISRELPNAEFQIYGVGTEYDSLVKLASDLGLDGKVFFHPVIPFNEIVEVMSGADLSIEPKRADTFANEALSMKILEFMALGVPVVASRTLTHEYYFNDSLLQFFESGNPDDLADKVLNLARNPGLREKLVANSKAFIEQNNWETKKHEYLEIIDSLLRK